MTTEFACFLAGICVAGVITIWFSTAYRELSEKRGALDGLREQLLLHQNASAQVRDGPEQAVAEKMLATNQSIFREAVSSYNQLLKEPKNQPPRPVAGLPSGG